jgi:2-polyprenyl-6-methoxyphenol hydroxylase-like FAD-dependent oxidoreductase
MTKRYDVAIVGGGIAGAALGGLLAAAGLGVVVVEKEGTFRDRVRGEAIHPWGVAEAKQLGLLPVLAAAGAHELPIWQNYQDRSPKEPYRWADDSIDGLPELAVSHPRMQESMLDWAGSRGAEVLRPVKVLDLRPGPELVVADHEGERTLGAQLIIGADGRRSAVRRWIGGKTVQDPIHHRIGGALFDDVALDSAATHEAGFAGGRLFAIPQGTGRARIYFVSSADRLAVTHAQRSPADFLRACADHLPEGALGAAVPAGPVAFFANADVWSTLIANDSAVLIGDAAGANDPSVGQGLSIVFRDVRALRDLLLGERDWTAALRAFAERRAVYYDVLRRHAMWLGILTTEEGPTADRRRELAARARESDPSAGGFALIFARGPDALVADEAARRRFFGENGS